LFVWTVGQDLVDFGFRGGVKTEKSGGVARGEGECGDDVVGLLVRDRRSLDILPVKKGKAVCE